MKRFYMYVIYRLHDCFRIKDSTPIGSTVITMCIIHFFQIFAIGLYVNIFFDIKIPAIPKELSFYLIILSVFIVYYFLVFYNGNWRNWVKEFQNETSEERKKNGVKVWIFCWGSVMFFFASLPLTFSIIKMIG